MREYRSIGVGPPALCGNVLAYFRRQLGDVAARDLSF